MKKIFAFLMTALLLLSLTACGGASAEGYADTAAVDFTEAAAEEPAAAPEENGYGWSEDAMAAEQETGVPSDDDTANYAATLKIIKTGDLAIESETFDETDNFIRTTVDSYSGILAERSISGMLGSRWASYTVRIPSASFDDFFYDITGRCTVTSQSISAEDVTERYTDLATQLETNQKKYDRLLELMDKAETLADIYSIESEITTTEYEIDRITGILNGLDSRISYSTIYINVAETNQETTIPQEPSFGASLSAALKNGTSSAVSGIQRLILGVARRWFGCLVFLIIVIVVLVVVLRVRKKKKAAQLAAMHPKDDDEDADL